MAAAAVHPNPSVTEAPAAHTAAVESALIPAAPAQMTRPDVGTGIDRDSVVCRMPVELEVAVPVREFRLRNLVELSPGVVVASQWKHGEDLPLDAGDVQLAWVEFEVVDTTLAARITRPA